MGGETLDYVSFCVSLDADVLSGSMVSLLAFSFSSVQGFSFSAYVCTSEPRDSGIPSSLTGCPIASFNSALPVQDLVSRSPTRTSRPFCLYPVMMVHGASTLPDFITLDFRHHSGLLPPLTQRVPSPTKPHPSYVPLVLAIITAGSESCHSHLFLPRTFLPSSSFSITMAA